MKCDAVDTSKMVFIGIGKILFNSSKTKNYNIPHLHFILSKENDEIEAINLEFGLVCSGADENEAVENLSEMLIEYIERTISSINYEALIRVATTCAMNKFWNEYRKIEFILAKNKDDLGNHILDAIRSLVLHERNSR